MNINSILKYIYTSIYPTYSLKAYNVDKLFFKDFIYFHTQTV